MCSPSAAGATTTGHPLNMTLSITSFGRSKSIANRAGDSPKSRRLNVTRSSTPPLTAASRTPPAKRQLLQCPNSNPPGKRNGDVIS